MPRQLLHSTSVLHARSGSPCHFPMVNQCTSSSPFCPILLSSRHEYMLMLQAIQCPLFVNHGSAGTIEGLRERERGSKELAGLPAGFTARLHEQDSSYPTKRPSTFCQTNPQCHAVHILCQIHASGTWVWPECHCTAQIPPHLLHMRLVDMPEQSEAFKMITFSFCPALRMRPAPPGFAVLTMDQLHG
jgi:hypothetical protein